MFAAARASICSRTRGIATGFTHAALALALLLGPPAAAGAGETGPLRPAVITPAEWGEYTTRFLTPDGRVVDREGGGITHSEGQGYGMLLALEAGDRAAFDRIWRFTRQNMQIRGDGLIAWRWDPRTFPRVVDGNNASDGDVLIAYALVAGAAVWNDRALMRDGDRIVRAIADTLVTRERGFAVLRPGAYGFDRPSGAVLNLSYYVYPAFRMFAAVRPDGPWARLVADGERLTAAARFGPLALPPDWVAIDGDALALPADFRAASSYDAVRIPLYMMLDGALPAQLAIFDAAWSTHGGVPLDVSFEDDRPIRTMNEPGYRLIAGLVSCVVRGQPIDPDLTRFTPGTYFASTLHLLAIATLRRHHSECTEVRS
jgi:endoglucanase